MVVSPIFSFSPSFRNSRRHDWPEIEHLSKPTRDHREIVTLQNDTPVTLLVEGGLKAKEKSFRGVSSSDVDHEAPMGRSGFVHVHRLQTHDPPDNEGCQREAH